MKWKWFVVLFLLYSFFMGLTKILFNRFYFQESGSSVQDDQCPLQLQPHHPHGSWRWHPDSEAHGSSHHPGDRRSGEAWLTMVMIWHVTPLSPYRRLVTAATARAPWPGRSRSRESSPCLVRAPASCPRPACPPTPRPLSAPSATQRSVAWGGYLKWRKTLTAPITLC